MNAETRTCRNCRYNFTIEAEDFVFYEKVRVPAPTWCPECRMRRRVAFRNERTLYRRTCDLCRANIIAMYPTDAPYIVYCEGCWNSDRWDPMSCGRPYDFTRPFFLQFQELLLRVPRIHLEGTKNINSPFTNYTWESKNAYLAPSGIFSENVYYCKAIDKAKDCVDCTEAVECELCYELFDSYRSHSSQFLVHARDCMNSAFLFDCVNCSYCVLCTNLRNKSYCLRNVQYSKEEYLANIKTLKLDSYEGRETACHEFDATMRRALHKYAYIVNGLNALGNNLRNVKNVKDCFEMYNLDNVRYAARGYNIKDSADMYGTDDTEGDYECINNGLFSSRIQFSTNTHTNCLDVRYTDYCRASSYLFGCAGLRNKQYCILNVQYTKEEYEALVQKIIEHMNAEPYFDQKGRMFRYGEFFPLELSPFAYNETIAQEYMPFTKDQALQQGFRWKEQEAKQYTITLTHQELPQRIQEVSSDILGAVLGCAHRGECNEQCATAFKITSYELDFYRKMSIPLPRLCSNCRHYARLRFRNPWKLWKRKCNCGRTEDLKLKTKNVYQNTAKHFHGEMPCLNEFETSYEPGRPEVVYCEVCYQTEVA